MQLYALLVKSGGEGGVNELSLRFIILLPHGLLCVFTVMSDYTLDEPGFKAPGAPTPAPPSSDSSVENPPEVRRKCIACPRKIPATTQWWESCYLNQQVTCILEMEFLF